jgi:hypothetical protein
MESRQSARKRIYLGDPAGKFWFRQVFEYERMYWSNNSEAQLKRLALIAGALPNPRLLGNA